MFEVILRLYRYITESENIAEEELKKLGEIIRTRSQLNRSIEFITITKISHGDVKGLLMLRGDEEEVLKEVNLLMTLIRSSFRSIDIELVPKDVISSIVSSVKNFL